MKKDLLRKIGIYVLKFLVIILALVAVLVTAFLFMNRNEIKTLKGFKKESPANMYSMIYYSDYFLDDYLVKGSADRRELGTFLQEKLMHGFVAKVQNLQKNCSAFVCHNEKGDVLFCRNFDADFSPVVILTTEPENGYRSISASNIAEVGYNKKNLPNPSEVSLNNLNLLAAPYLTTDGMNEHGLAMTLLSSGICRVPEIEGAPTLNQSTVIRMILDKAKTIDEAIELMQKYNYNFGKWSIHFMLADSTGRAVVVEFYKGELVTLEEPVVTNFDLYDSLHAGTGKDRYNKIIEVLDENNGVLNEQQALELLENVGMRGMKQYSLIYNLSTGEVTAFTGGDCSVTASFCLE